jgi:hypothetical protein
MSKNAPNWTDVPFNDLFNFGLKMMGVSIIFGVILAIPGLFITALLTK